MHGEKKVWLKMEKKCIAILKRGGRNIMDYSLNFELGNLNHRLYVASFFVIAYVDNYASPAVVFILEEKKNHLAAL